MRSCPVCGKPAVGWKYCSADCRNYRNKADARSRWRSKHPLIVRSCCLCGVKFETYNPTKKMCGGKPCKSIAEAGYMRKYLSNRKTIKWLHWFECERCGCESISKTSRARFCSKRCERCSRRKYMSAEQKKKRLEQSRKRYWSCKEYREKARRASAVYALNRYKTNPVARIRMCLRKRIKAMARRGGHSASALIGCSGLELRKWLESGFSWWMNWENYGKSWVVDHRIPLAAFDLTDAKQLQMACHYTNLQPMSALKNNRKSDTITDPQYMLRM